MSLFNNLLFRIDRSVAPHNQLISTEQQTIVNQIQGN